MIHLPASEGGVAPSRTGSFLYTCLGAVLSLVLMPHVAKLTGRALGHGCMAGCRLARAWRLRCSSRFSIW